MSATINLMNDTKNDLINRGYNKHKVESCNTKCSESIMTLVLEPYSINKYDLCMERCARATALPEKTSYNHR